MARSVYRLSNDSPFIKGLNVEDGNERLSIIKRFIVYQDCLLGAAATVYETANCLAYLSTRFKLVMPLEQTFETLERWDLKRTRIRERGQYAKGALKLEYQANNNWA